MTDGSYQAATTAAETL